jgi:hypothetical protein
VDAVVVASGDVVWIGAAIVAGVVGDPGGFVGFSLVRERGRALVPPALGVRGSGVGERGEFPDPLRGEIEFQLSGVVLDIPRMLRCALRSVAAFSRPSTVPVC